jgi:mannose-6-phosphate isomerase
MEKLKPKIVAKIWGHEEIGINTDKYCGKILHLDRGYRCSIHRHPKDETFRMLNGMMLLELGENFENMENSILMPGDWIRIKPNFWHRFSGLKDTEFIEFSTPDSESERKTKSEKIPNFEIWKEENLI